MHQSRDEVVPWLAALKLSAALLLCGLLVWLLRGTAAYQDIRLQLWSLNSLYYADYTEKVKARVLPLADRRFSLLSGGTPVEPPVATVDGGFHRGPLLVGLVPSDPESIIYYTLDGSTPTRQSELYRALLRLDRTSVLRFRAFRAGYLPSPTVTHTYLVDEALAVRAVSLGTDPVHLWNRHSGIYANPKQRRRAWERPAHFEYFPAGVGEPLRFDAAVRIHGGSSRSNDKKSFRVRYSLASVVGRDLGNILTAPGPEPERTVILRMGGSNVDRTRDELFQSLYSEVAGYTSAFTPVMLYLNGELWGLYNIRESPDLEYLRRHVGPGDYDLIADQGLHGPAVAGSGGHWKATLELFETADLSEEAVFRRAAELVDVENFTDYWLYNIYAANLDWPHHNILTFRRRDGADGRWRWIAWDADATFDLRGQGLWHDTLAWSTRAELRHDLRYNAQKGLTDREENLPSTLIPRGLLRNDTYRDRFILRLFDLLNSHLAPANAEARLDAIVALTLDDAPKDWARWSLSAESFYAEVAAIRRFVRERPAIIRNYFRRHFGLGNPVTVELASASAGAGQVAINSIRPGRYPWRGEYFQGATLALTATAAPGYEFVGWTDPRLGTTPEIQVRLVDDVRMGAIFAPKRAADWMARD